MVSGRGTHRGKCFVDKAFELYGVFVVQICEQLTGDGTIIVVGRGIIVPPLQLDRCVRGELRPTRDITSIPVMRIHRHRRLEPL